MKKVKIFSGYSTDSVEKEINDFLAEFGEKIEETERLMSITVYPGEYRYVIAIFYKEK